MRSSLSTPTIIDLFSGAGLLSYAFKKEGFNPIRAVEVSPSAAKTYVTNIGDHITVSDIRKVKPEGRCDVLAAGPPCQGFSTLGKRDKNDPRNFLSMQVVRWAAVLRPRIVVIENVAAFLGAPVWGMLSRAFERLGYAVTAGIYNAVDFGVPQLRSRSFTFASRGVMPVVESARRAGFATVREAWDGLSPTPDSRNNHEAPSPSEIALSRMRLIPPGGDKRDVMRRAPRLAAPSWWKLPGDVTDVWGRMEWDQPSNTLRTALQNASKGRYIHPEQHRVITLREACRLHTIPDGWKFAGWASHIAAQIGNSVPPALGKAIARAVRAAI